MGAQGTAEVDFGAFPGASDASVAVSAPTVSAHPTSLAEAWLIPNATTDHSGDEHWVESIKVMAGPCAAGVGFTVYAVNTSQINEPLERIGNDKLKGLAAQTVGGVYPSVGGMGTRLYGKWTIGWVWN
jgi:hypothetical protein